MEQVCKQIEPEVVFLGRSALGRDVGPRVAFRLDAGLAQDCIEVTLDAGTGKVIVRRPVYGGNAVATATFGEDGPQFIIMRAKVYEPLEPDQSREGDIVRLSVDIEPLIEYEDYLDPRRIESRTSSYQGSLYGAGSNDTFSAFLRHLPRQSRHK